MGKADEYGPVRKTRFAELDYQRQGAGNWRLIWTETGATVGPNYATQDELLADLQAQYESRCSAPKTWCEVLLERLTAIAEHYERSAPTVNAWANDLYARCGENPDGVRLSELLAVDALFGATYADAFEPANFAANRVYKLMSRLGQNTTGHAGF